MPKDKASCQKNHFKKRLDERYNLKINNEEYEYLTSLIRKHEHAKHLIKQSNRLSVFLMDYKGIEFVAVYDKIRKTLLTALPPECKDVSKIDYFCEEYD